MKHCPECNTKLIDLATECRCGSKQAPLTLIPCDGQPGCMAHGSIRVGQLNYCRACYVTHAGDGRAVVYSPACADIIRAYRNSPYFRAQHSAEELSK